MENNDHSTVPFGQDALPFPADWITTSPQKAEAALNKLPVSEQGRYLLQLQGKARQDLILLSHNALQLVQALPEEELYLTVKEIGEGDALPILSIASTEQLQYCFDLEWWSGDKFQPLRVLEWLEWIDQSSDQHWLNWFRTEELELKITLLQSLIKVRLKDQAIDPLDSVEEMVHFTPDGVYHIFFKKKEAVDVLKRMLMQLYAEETELFATLMKMVVIYQVTPTLETAYRWRQVRVAEKGIPEFDEAMGVYSQLKPEALRVDPPSASEFSERAGMLVPNFPLWETDPSTFLGQCLAMMKDAKRFDAICWELVYLSNKVLVADRGDMANLEVRRDVLRKVLGYINIGLELGAGGDFARGEGLLKKTWMQSLFQVGHAGLMRLKWEAEQLIRENGELVNHVLDGVHFEHLIALIERFPKVGVLVQSEEDNAHEVMWRDLLSISDLQILENFLIRLKFYVRFTRMGLSLDADQIRQIQEEARFPERPEDFDMMTLFTTALAHYVLFGKVSCEPLSDSAAQSFLQMIFLPMMDQGAERVCNPDLIESFAQKLQEGPLAWTENDRESLQDLLQGCQANLSTHFGRLNLKQSIDWQYTRGLCIK